MKKMICTVSFRTKKFWVVQRFEPGPHRFQEVESLRRNLLGPGSNPGTKKYFRYTRHYSIVNNMIRFRFS